VPSLGQGQCVGASGAIFGLVGMSLLWAPKNELHLVGLLGMRALSFDVSILAFCGWKIAWDVLGWLLGTDSPRRTAAAAGRGGCGTRLESGWCGDSDSLHHSLYVGLNLALEFLYGAERSKRADFSHKVDGERPSVKVSTEPDEVTLHLLQLLAEGRIRADAGGHGKLATVDVARSGVDSVCREHSINVGEVCRRKSECPSALGAGDDSSFESQQMSELADGGPQMTCREQLADAAGGNHSVGVIDWLHFDKRQAMSQAERPEQSGVAFPGPAEMKIRTFHDPASGKLIKQYAGEEVGGRHLQQFLSHREHNDVVHPGRQQQSRAFGNAGD
jgi:hypothetical protein